MRNKFADVFYELGRENEKLAIVVADISPAGSIAKFREEFPKRFVNTGVAEQIMIGMVAGMAMRGLRPFAYTIATFALYRPFEFIRDDIAYQELPVTIVGVGGGVAYCTLGGTHHAMEDVAVASAIPGMQVVAPCDPLEAADLTRWCANESQRPTYMRLGKAGEPIVTDKADPFEFGKLRYLQRGSDVCFIAYGPIINKAIAKARLLEAQGVSCSVVSCHTLKPLDTSGVADMLGAHDKVIVMEEHVPQGGLGVQVKALAYEAGAKCQIVCHSLQDRFIHFYGSHDELLAVHDEMLG